MRLSDKDALRLARYKLLNHHVLTPTGCWQWQKALSTGGYGQVRVNGVSKRAHRAAYEMFVGPIPDGLEIDHLCRNRACINPEHLEPVTRLENQRRKPYYARSECQRGHPLDEHNTFIDGIKRGCRACRKQRDRRRSARRRAQTFSPNRVRARRTQYGWTLQQLADMVQVSFGYLAELERGQAKASAATQSRLADALGTSESALFDMADLA